MISTERHTQTPAARAGTALASQGGEGRVSGDYPCRLAAGTRVAGYRAEKLVASGGMAEVYQARDERLGRPVALKVLAPVLAADREFRRRFTAESRAAAAVDHPNIIPIYEPAFRRCEPGLVRGSAG
jgi:serine/threonine protein kinase